MAGGEWKSCDWSNNCRTYGASSLKIGKADTGEKQSFQSFRPYCAPPPTVREGILRRISIQDWELKLGSRERSCEGLTCCCGVVQLPDTLHMLYDSWRVTVALSADHWGPLFSTDGLELLSQKVLWLAVMWHHACLKGTVAHFHVFLLIYPAVMFSSFHTVKRKQPTLHWVGCEGVWQHHVISTSKYGSNSQICEGRSPLGCRRLLHVINI